ncbi:MAG TPA: hypothetical protein VKB12_06255 [Pyrinomonadaceae bacterium]|nr:hypothetical protein [Pyrinomonadaceae bacterium]
MKCQEFRSNVDGLARGALLDARVRDAAAAHEEACGACAARLADERALTAGLRALAASMREASAPARAEVGLLSAFRSRAAAAAAAASTEGAGVACAVSKSHAPSNVVPLSEHAGARQLSWVKTVAIAAMAAAAAVALFMLVPPFLSTPAPASRSAAKNTQSTPVQTQNNASATNAGRDETARAGVGQTASSPKGVDSPTQKLTDEGVAPGASTQRRNVVRGTNASYNPARVVAPNRGADAADAGEITTEFIPLVRDAFFAQSEGAHLVRVELPRSALASFGIPVNADRAGDRVKADVLLGEDGTARAIRFVR